MNKTLISLKKEVEKKIQLLQRADYSGAGLPAFAPTMKQIALYRELAQLEMSAGNPEDAAAAYSELNDVLDQYMRSIGSYPISHGEKRRDADKIRHVGNPKNLAGISFSIKSGQTKFGAIPTVTVTAEDSSGDVAGIAEFEQVGGDWEPQSTNVATKYQRKGVASAMYALVEQETGMKVIPSESQTKEGRSLWAQRDRNFGKQK
jgi:hypothetical protein